VVTPEARREAVTYITAVYPVGERCACRLVGLSRSVYRYQAKRPDDSEIQGQLTNLAAAHQRWGFDKMMDRFRQQGFRWNHKRGYRVYRNLGLNHRVKPKKRLPVRHPQPLVEPDRANHTWSLDFMNDTLTNGRTFRTLNIIDDFNREALWIEIDTSLPAQRVIRVLNQLVEMRGSSPVQIRSDNGPEFIAQAVADWAEQYHVLWDFIEPGCPA
jgi:putative transposase